MRNRVTGTPRPVAPSRIADQDVPGVTMGEILSHVVDNFDELIELRYSAEARAKDAARVLELLDALESHQHAHTDQLSRITALVEQPQPAPLADVGALVLNRALVAWALWLLYGAFAVYMAR